MRPTENSLSAPTPGLLRSVWKLMHLRLVIITSSFRRAKTARKVVWLMITLIVLGLFGAMFVGSWALLGVLQSPHLAQIIGDLQAFIMVIPTLTVTAAFIGVLLTSFGVMLQALYLAGDMEFLLATPVPMRAVFVSKLLQAILPNFAIVSLFALPVLFGLGASYGYHIVYYPLVVIVLSALALAAAGIAAMLVILIVRIFPARRVAEVLGFVGAIASFMCSQSGQFARYEDITPDQAGQVFQSINYVNTPWSPLAWAGHGLVEIGQGNWPAGAGLLLVTLAMAGVIFGVALLAAERLYYTGWANVKVQAQRKKAPRKVRDASNIPLTGFFETQIPAPVRAIFVKDLLVMRRDLRNMSQLIMPLIIGVLYAFMFFRDIGDTSSPDNLPALATEVFANIRLYANVGLALFVSWMLLARLAGMGFSQEGKGYWIIKSAPVGIIRLIASKFLVAYLPVLMISSIYLLVISLLQGAGFASLIFTMPVIALTIFGNTGINLAFGVIGANFTWEDPRRMQTGGSGCLSSLASVLYIPFSLGLFFAPAVILRALSLPQSVGEMIGLVLGGGFSILCALLPLWLVRQRVPVLGE